MSSHVLSLLIVGLFFQLLPQALSVHASVIPQSISIATTNATLRGHSAYCSDNGGWVGDGIRKSDCADAISEFTRTEVDPRGEQKFEFRSRGVHKTSVLPTVTTPRKYDYGTCVIIIAMLDTVFPGTLPGVQPRQYAQSDIATFYNVFDATLSVSRQCVQESKPKPKAGWSFTGSRNSLGVFILRRGSDLDKVLQTSLPTNISISNETVPMDAVDVLRSANSIDTTDS